MIEEELLKEGHSLKGIQNLSYNGDKQKVFKPMYDLDNMEENGIS